MESSGSLIDSWFDSNEGEKTSEEKKKEGEMSEMDMSVDEIEFKTTKEVEKDFEERLKQSAAEEEAKKAKKGKEKEAKPPEEKKRRVVDDDLEDEDEDEDESEKKKTSEEIQKENEARSSLFAVFQEAMREEPISDEKRNKDLDIKEGRDIPEMEMECSEASVVSEEVKVKVNLLLKNQVMGRV